MVSAEGWVESCQDSAVRSCGHRDDFKLQDVIAHPSELVLPMDEDERLVERELGGCMLSRVTNVNDDAPPPSSTSRQHDDAAIAARTLSLTMTSRQHDTAARTHR